MPHILSLPVESLTQIFQGFESFSQVTALSSTCKFLNSVWLNNARPVIWDVGRHEILAFDGALMAVSSSSAFVNLVLGF